MYASLEDAWQEPMLIPSEHGFVLHPRHRPEFLSPTAVHEAPTVDTMMDHETLEAPPRPVRLSRPYPPPPRYRMTEGFDGGSPYRSRPSREHEQVLHELQRLREELEWVRRERSDIQRRLDFLCLLLFGISILFVSDMVRRWAPASNRV